ncbi:MAG: hypothetical protein COU47_00865 [Candidatus Niyogibacteria bacterium CG10_big_fil_rev_8_21_14_0_10_46_36]|uniref:Class I SAM-dependent methyltransferase n=1 Tax=Candidatus Niyogibacteria bacterium CG10_big_fil_rev_8_21_14_0_10_46_36 TaxID=1974726 RepID=A0A2H0TEJ2_9BACT|nr:MAG: hypothetical protein COU47_00865 [Candidatus Niyogibacteria bacterium CG10_big_fil_rev_8_21_14_0_10_46_36]
MSKRITLCNNCVARDFHTLLTFRGNEGYDFLGDSFDVVVCKRCGLCFLHPRPAASAYAAYYSGGLGSRKKRNNTLSKESILDKKRYQEWYADWVVRHWGLPKTASVLEVGCGMGAFLYFLKERGYENVSGVEMGEEAAQKAQDVFGVPITVGDFFSQAYSPGSYDAVVGIALIEHMLDPRAAIKRMGEALKPGGVLYLNTPDLYGMTFRKQFFKFVHTYYFTSVTLSSLLEQEGFEVERMLSVPLLKRHSNIFFPENCIPGEIHIIAKKTGIKKTFKKEKHQDIVRLCSSTKIKELPYLAANKLFLNKYAGPLRTLRARFRDAYKKNPKSEMKEFFETI